MKKLNLIVWMAALMGLATSCSKDDASLPGNPENSNRVSMSVTLPQDMAATRAVPASPTGHQLRCILEVWTADGNTLKIRKELAQTTTSDFTFEFDLEDAGDYKAVLWADYIGTSTAESSGYYADKYYTTNAGTLTTGLKTVAVKTLTATDASYRDAFTGVEEFTKGTGALSLTPTLTRALTKISIFEKTQDNYNLCGKVTATYKVPSKFNALTGTADLTNDLKDASYAAAPEGSTNSMLLFSDYVLANADGTLGEIGLTFESNEGSKLLADVTIPAGIPAKRNYRINAKGNLIRPSDAPSNSVKMEVSISEGFTGDEEEEVNLLEVGDFYMGNGTCIDKNATLTDEQKNNCIGIVYEVNADGKTGKIVGLTEGTLAWSTEIVTTGATSLTDGRANMSTIATYITNNNKSWDAYPAFKWVAAQNGKDTGGWDASNDKWYLPAKEELQALYAAWNGGATTPANNDARTAFNAQLTSARGAILSSSLYWSSSEGNSNNSWSVSFNSGSTYYDIKTYYNRVRCVRKF